MSLIVVPQVNPNDEVTALSVNQGPNAIAAAVNGNLDDANISSLSGSKISAGTLPGTSLAQEASPYLRMSESIGDFVASGGVWSALTGLNAGMNAAIVYLNGERKTVAAVATRAFTASRDTYVSVDSTGTLAYQDVANNATAPALATGSLHLSIIVTNATNVTLVRDLRIMGHDGITRTWTPSPTGYTGTVTVNTSTFTRMGKIVYMDLDFTGTSNATSVTFTLPVPPRYSARQACIVSDNGVFQLNPGLIRYTAGSRTGDVSKDFNASNFTTSGSKSVRIFGVIYEGI